MSSVPHATQASLPVPPAVKTEGQEQPRYFTDAKIKKIALYTLAALCLVSFVTFPAIAIFGNMPLLLIPTMVAMFAFNPLVDKAMHIRDYDNPKEVSQHRKDAQVLTFSMLKGIHGVENLPKFLSKEEIRVKITKESLQFSEQGLSLELDDLVKHGIIDESQKASILQYRADFVRSKKDVEERFENRLANELKVLANQLKVKTD